MPVPTSSSPAPRHRRSLGTASAGALALLGLAVLTACSSTASSAAAGTTAPTPAPSSGAPGAGRAGGPAASGLIAAVDGSTLQVQSRQDGQVAVTWSAATTFTQQVTLTPGAIAAGDCVTATAASGGASATAFTATTVRVTPAVNGACTGGFGGAGRTGARPSGAPSGGTRPSGAPTGGVRPSGAPGRTGTFAAGQVVSVSGTTVVVAARQFGAGANSGSGSAPATVDDTVTVDATTTVTGEQAATAAAATVGRCATAQGQADATGTVAATGIAVTDAVNGTCTGGFGGFGGRPGGATASGTATHG